MKSQVPPSFPRSLDDCLKQIDRSVAFRSAFMDAISPGSESLINPALRQPLRDAIGLFTSLQIPYAMVGGVAAMVYGRARFTDDVDFVAASTHEKILAANPEAMRAHHFDPASNWKLYHDSGIEIDIWKDEFSDDIAGRAKTFQFGEQTIRIAEVHDLIAMKLRADRPQDDYDISEIIKQTVVDEGVLQGRVTVEQFAHFLVVKMRTRAAKS